MIKCLVALILVVAISASALAASEKAKTRPQPQSTSEHPGRQMREHNRTTSLIGDVTTILVGNVNTGSRAIPPFANTTRGAALVATKESHLRTA